MPDLLLRRVLFAFLTVAGVCSAGLRAQAATFDQPAVRAEVAAKFARNLEQLAEQSRTLRQRPLQPQDLVLVAGREVAGLYGWVQQHTSYVPYRGCLRGGAGVLADGTGNDLDRSLLLAAALRGAGHEARLARGRLDGAVAQQLAAGCALLPPPSDQVLGEVAEDALAMTASLSARLLSALGDAPAGAPVDAAALLQDHWWVEVRDGKEFVACDLMAKVLGEALAKATDHVDAGVKGFAVPASERHSVRLGVVLEQVIGDKRQEHTVLTADLHPADWTGVPIELSFFCYGWPAGVGKDRRPEAMPAFKAALLAQKEWLPVLTLGKERIAKASFDATGKVDENPSLSGEAKFGAAVGRDFDALSGESGDSGPQGLLTALWLDCEVTAPGHAPARARHELFDLLGPAARAAGKLPKEVGEAQRLDRALVLLSVTEVLALGGKLAPDVARRLDVEGMLAQRGAARSLSGIADEAAFKQALGRLAGDLLQPRELLTFAALRSSLGELLGPVYLDRANLVCCRRRLAWDGSSALQMRNLIDVVCNDVAVAPGGDARAARLRQGVLDTIAEELALGNELGGSANTVALFARAPGAPLVLRPGSMPAPPPPEWPADAAARIGAELAAGNTVVLVPRPLAIADAPEFGWWRIEPGRGDCIGVMASGFRQDTSEHTVITTREQLARRLIDFVGDPKNAARLHRTLFNGAPATNAEMAAIRSLQSVVQEIMADAWFYGIGM